MTRARWERESTKQQMFVPLQAHQALDTLD